MGWRSRRGRLGRERREDESRRGAKRDGYEAHVPCLAQSRAQSMVRLVLPYLPTVRYQIRLPGPRASGPRKKSQGVHRHTCRCRAQVRVFPRPGPRTCTGWTCIFSGVLRAVLAQAPGPELPAQQVPRHSPKQPPPNRPLSPKGQPRSRIGLDAAGSTVGVCQVLGSS